MAIRDSKACVSCRVAKIRCDKLRPCTRCLKRDEKCMPQAVGSQLGEAAKLPAIDWKNLVHSRGPVEPEVVVRSTSGSRKASARQVPPTSPPNRTPYTATELHEAQLGISEVVVRWAYQLVSKQQLSDDKAARIMSTMEQARDTSGHDLYPGLPENLAQSCGLAATTPPAAQDDEEEPLDTARLQRLLNSHTGRDPSLAALAWPMGQAVCAANELFTSTFCPPSSLLTTFGSHGVATAFFAAWLVVEEDRDDFCTSLSHALFSTHDVSKRFLRVHDARGVELSCISRLRVLWSRAGTPVLLLSFQRAPTSRHLGPPCRVPAFPPPQGLAAVGKTHAAPQEALPTVLPSCQMGFSIDPSAVLQQFHKALSQSAKSANSLSELLVHTAGRYAARAQPPPAQPQPHPTQPAWWSARGPPAPVAMPTYAEPTVAPGPAAPFQPQGNTDTEWPPNEQVLTFEDFFPQVASEPTVAPPPPAPPPAMMWGPIGAYRPAPQHHHHQQQQQQQQQQPSPAKVMRLQGGGRAVPMLHDAAQALTALQGQPAPPPPPPPLQPQPQQQTDEWALFVDDGDLVEPEVLRSILEELM